MSCRLQIADCRMWFVSLVIFVFPEFWKSYIFKPKANKGGDNPTTWPVQKNLPACNQIFFFITTSHSHNSHLSLSHQSHTSLHTTISFFFSKLKCTNHFFIIIIILVRLFTFIPERCFWSLGIAVHLHLCPPWHFVLSSVWFFLWLGCERAPCSPPFYVLQLQRREDNGSSAITGKKQRHTHMELFVGAVHTS